VPIDSLSFEFTIINLDEKEILVGGGFQASGMVEQAYGL
jgi:hypothetical protein